MFRLLFQVVGKKGMEFALVRHLICTASSLDFLSFYWCRPIKIMMEDVKVLVPVEVRNAILGIFMHMSSAFSGPPQGPSVDLGDISQPAECVTTVKTPEQQESSHNPTAGIA